MYVSTMYSPAKWAISLNSTDDEMSGIKEAW